MPNYTPANTIAGHNNQNNSQSIRIQRTVLDYSARDNMEGAVACIEGHMSYRDHRDVMLFTLTENGDLGPFPLARWSMEDSGSREPGKAVSRLQVLQHILKSLLVR